MSEKFTIKIEHEDGSMYEASYTSSPIVLDALFFEFLVGAFTAIGFGNKSVREFLNSEEI